jgi:very-short-patch-repair endonuclease
MPETNAARQILSPLLVEQVRAGIEQIRLRLLDLTGRNRLISFRHTKSTLRAVDADLDRVHAALIAGKQLPFLPVPEPTKVEIAANGEKPSAREYAEALGWRVSFDLQQNAGHSDGLRVLHYKEDFDVLIRKIGTTAKTAIEESGANLLHLVFGFLEWRESDDSTQVRHAPLLVVPVNLLLPKAREADKAIKLEYKGEDVTTNLSLVEKMRRDFGIDIPVLEDDETPEAYFRKFSEILEQKRDWRICKQISLGLLSFGKLLMYLDLDAARWPDDALITHHPRLVDIFTGSSVDGLQFASEYELDEEVKIAPIPPLICDADSSQHSALIDATRGSNLVIEGPPGTGKSQTITNLIAAFLSQGKRVLFVAEKMAALDVVKRRLDQGRLGDFCLELHSHKTNKVTLLKSLESRIDAHRTFSEPSALAYKSGLLDSHREELTTYVKVLNKPFGAIGLTPFEIIWRRDKLRPGLAHSLFKTHSITFPDSPLWDMPALQERRDAVATFQAHLRHFFEAGGSMRESENPWWWLPASEVNFSGQQALLDNLAKLRDVTECQRILIGAFRSKLSEVIDKPDEWLPQVSAWRHQLLEPDANVRLSLVSILTSPSERDAVSRFLVELEAYLSAVSALPGGDLLLRTDMSESIQAQISELGALGVESFTLEGLQSIVARVAEAKRESTVAERAVNELSAALGVDAAFSARCLEDLLAGRELIDLAPMDLLHLRHQKFGLDGLGGHLRAAQREAVELLTRQVALSSDFVIEDPTSAADLDNAINVLEITPWFKRWFSSSYRRAKAVAINLCLHPNKKTPSQMATGLRFISAHKHKVTAFNGRTDLQSKLGDDFRGVETTWEVWISLADWYEQVTVRLPDHVTFASEVRTALLNLPTSRLKGIASAAASETPKADELKVLFEILEQLHSQLPQLKFERSTTRLDQFLTDADAVASRAEQLLTIVEPLQLSESITAKELQALRSDVDLLRARRQRLTSNSELQRIIGLDFRGLDTDRLRLQQTIDFVVRLEGTSLPIGIKRWLLCEQCEENRLWVLDWLGEFEGNTQLLTAAESEVTSILRAHVPFAKQFSLSGLENAIAALDSCLARPDLLPMWIDLRNASEKLKGVGLQCLVEGALKSGLPVEEMLHGFEFLFCDSMIRILFDGNPHLWKMTGINQEETRRRFVELDNSVIALNQLEIAYRASRKPIPQGLRGNVVKETTELALIHHEINKQKQHIPIRQLLLRAGQAIQALKPCFMMSPMSVAQFLAPGNLHFDLVVMDEASQLRPEDALGAIARGTQLVVVGDPKQLPPTSFFQRTLDDEQDDEEKTIAAEGESILDIALGRYQPVRRLRWHYRSQHHSLIAFSNQEFYGGDLVVFPSAYHDHPDLGVKFVAVEGIYENRRNALEAQRVVDAILEHIALHPDDSLGVVTMNFEQRELIEELLDARLAHDSFSKVWMEGREETHEPFFIKNLENVQGDERDVIFISVTYGKDAQGNLFQRFAGVNSKTGQRRLNVLITRAKKRTVVFSSIDGDQIQVTPSTPWGVKALKGYLDYAKKGISSQPELSPGAEPANEHEAAIGYVLQEYGYDVVPQVGVSGYFIDLAVRHPSKPGTFLLGIEFDGKSYHSGRSARDRDRLRQMTLEKQGWKIHRIWSTDWFKNREAEVDRLLKRVRSLEVM